MSDYPIIPKKATGSTYSAGVKPWSGGAIRQTPDSNFELTGWTPDAPVPAQFENYWSYGMQVALDDAFDKSAIKRIARLANSANNYSVPKFFSFSKCLILEDGGSSYNVASNDLGQLINSAAATVSNGATRGAEYVSGTTGKLALLKPGRTGGQTIDVWSDNSTRTWTTPTLPGAGVTHVYTDCCQDVSTGRWIACSGGTTSGFASGDPAALTFVATSGGVAWFSDNNVIIASKPGETRAWRTNTLTYATPDGGVTVGLVANVGFTSGSASPMFSCTWDERNSRWLASFGDLSTSFAAASTAGSVWYSTNGTTWTKVVDTPLFTIVQVKYYKGWIFAIARYLDLASSPSHGGLEIIYSKDGGTTWKRPGITLTLESLAFNTTNDTLYRRSTAIDVAGANLIFSAKSIHATVANHIQCVILQANQEV